MANNLCYQLKQAIENSLVLGGDKHSIKKQQQESDYRIYSYASRKSLINFSYGFCGYMKENYPDIKMVKDITIEHINGYLASRAKVSQKTIGFDVAAINKLEKCVNKKYGIHVDWRTERIVPRQEIEKVRNITFSDKQIKGIEKHLKTKRECSSKDAYYIAKRFSLRASEVVNIQYRDIKWEKGEFGILHIHESKGKRSRDILLTGDDRKFFEELIKKHRDRGKDVSNRERIVALRSDSICAYLNRICKKLGYSNIIEKKTSYHALRKYTITKFYREQEKIHGKNKAKEMAMERLGHGKGRKDLFETYILL